MTAELETIEHIGRMSGDARRQQLLQVAVRLFSSKGFSGTTTKEIAQAAGVSEATLFKHFANKDALYSAILDHKACSGEFLNPFEKLADKIAAKDDFGVFYTMAFNALEHHASDCDFLRLMMHSALEEHDLARVFVEGFITDIYNFLGAYIAERQRDGAFREFNPRVAVRAFIGMFIHHSLQKMLWDKEERLLKISNQDAAREFATILLDGIRKK